MGSTAVCRGCSSSSPSRHRSTLAAKDVTPSTQTPPIIHMTEVEIERGVLADPRGAPASPLPLVLRAAEFRPAKAPEYYEILPDGTRGRRLQPRIDYLAVRCRDGCSARPPRDRHRVESAAHPRRRAAPGAAHAVGVSPPPPRHDESQSCLPTQPRFYARCLACPFRVIDGMIAEHKRQTRLTALGRPSRLTLGRDSGNRHATR